MKTPRFFITVFLCLIFSVNLAQAQYLKTKITLKVSNATLPQVLQQIQQKYAIRFSYLNNDLPVKNRISAEITEKPLSEVLDVLLAKTNVGYLEKNEQVIIKKGLPKNLPKSSTFAKLPAVTSVNQAKPVAKPTPAPDAKTEIPPKKPEQAINPDSSKVTENIPEELPVSTSENARVPETPTPLDSIATPSVTIPAKPVVFDEDSLEVRPFHLGLIYPLSTNGLKANEYVNNFSAHALVGTAAGLQGVEFAGFGNTEKKYVRGFQFSGFFNIIGNRVKLTTSTDSVAKRYSLQGGQFAGFLNIASGPSKGGQFAGFLNITRDITGVQGAGFLNVAQNVHGVQMAGFLNKAKYVKGVQLGFINIADSIKGVPIGFLNIVKHNGYRHAELYVAEDFNINFTYKIGVPQFYTLVALGAELDDKKRWGYGLGFGSEWTLYKSLRLNTDVLSYYVNENSYENFPDGLFTNNELNLLNKFRLLGTWQLGRHFALFGGPTFNVMVSQYQEPGEAGVGSTLPKNTFYDKTGQDGTNVKMGIGFNAGIRF